MRVVTFNIHHGTVGAWGPVDADRLAEVCAGFDADVLALQEVEVGTFRTWGTDLLGTVARRCGTSYAVANAHAMVRARADHLLAHNVRVSLSSGRMKRFTPKRRRWGSVVGTQQNALEVFAPNGRSFALRPWSVLQPWVVRRAIYRGIRRP